jgi:hypothetical protein
MVEPLRHRQTKGAATDMFYLTPPRHISTLPLKERPVLAQSGLSKIHRLVGEKGCDPVPPFRTMIPPNLRLKCEGPSPVRSATLVWLLLKHGRRRRSGAFLAR